MRLRHWRDNLSRHPHLESVEPRFLMTGESLTDSQIFADAEVVPPVDAAISQLGAYDYTGLVTALGQYGFTGAGQTVAVIDTGIAYDHPALGGGYGAGYRVVGGYDFAENDNNPYDDGPGGSHGTHVAGIIGASGGATTGVASGVDLVALRVFDDQGMGYFSLVQKALDWVDVHRNDFASPITTVNLSIGSNWNATTVPGWSTLENSFKKLKDDGIFIAVAAGNSFATYNAAGLSYPAASPYVVPVMAVDTSGNLAYYSQRQDSAIAAPGTGIKSTVPDYVGNLNGKPDDYATYSGTSMAAPYVAGASVLIRQALQFVGTANITEDMIYSIMKKTADTIYDSATKANYSRLNIQKALDSIIPADDFGSTAATASTLTFSGLTASTKGLISTLTDKDYFTFVASQSGVARFSATPSGKLAPVWSLDGGGGQLSSDGKTFSFDVVAGKSYTVGLATSGGIGYYALSATIDVSMIDLGLVDFKLVAGQNVSGENWYSFKATRTGLLTAEALFAQAGGAVKLELYNASKQLLATNSGTAGADRIDVSATAGDVFYVRAVGTNANVSLRITNLVTQVGSSVTIAGTSAADSIAITMGATRQIVVNGVSYSFAAAKAGSVSFTGGGGADSVVVTGGAGAHSATLNPRSATLVGVDYTVQISDAACIVVQGGGGYDKVSFTDSTGDDVFGANPYQAMLYGTNYYLRAEGFAWVEARATQGGFDTANLYDSPGDDTFGAGPINAMLYGANFYYCTYDFERVNGKSSGGNDLARLFDTAGDDVFTATPTFASMASGAFLYTANGFARVEGIASQGYDKAILWDSSGDDTFQMTPKSSVLFGSRYRNTAQNFDWVEAHASSGNDSAFFTDSEGDDRFGANNLSAMLYGANYYTRADGFEHVEATSSHGGFDQANLFDSLGDDLLTLVANTAVMSGSGYSNKVQGFRGVQGKSDSGADTIDKRGVDYLFTALGQWLAASEQATTTKKQG